jgi:hypothetical protein
VLILVGLLIFVAGAVLNYTGWAIDRRYPRRRGTEDGRDGLLRWFTSTLRQFFPILVGRDSSLGERVAAMGAILAAVGLVVTIVGLLPGG